MRILRILPLALVCLVGCGGGPSLVGKWNIKADKMPPGAKMVLEFTSTGYSQGSDFEQAGMKIHVDTIGTYTFDGKKLKMTTSEIKLDDSKLPEQIRALAKKQLEAQNAQLKGKTEEIDVKLEGDTAVFTQPSGNATLTRIK